MSWNGPSAAVLVSLQPVGAISDKPSRVPVPTLEPLGEVVVQGWLTGDAVGDGLLSRGCEATDGVGSDVPALGRLPQPAPARKRPKTRAA